MNRQLGSVIALLAILAGCASLRPAPSEMTGDGLKRVEIRDVDVAYVREGTDFRRFNKVLVDPVQVAFDPDWNPKRTGSNQPLPDTERERIRKEIAELFMEVFPQELSKDGGLALATGPGPDVLRLSTAVIDVYVNAPDTLTAGRSRTYAMNAGQATLVAEVRDSQSGAILGRLYDRRETTGSGVLSLSTSVSNSAEARRMFTRWGQALRKRIDAIRAAPGTVTQ